jgi:hypothetical protein
MMHSEFCGIKKHINHVAKENAMNIYLEYITKITVLPIYT